MESNRIATDGNSKLLNDVSVRERERRRKRYGERDKKKHREKSNERATVVLM